MVCLQSFLLRHLEGGQMNFQKCRERSLEDFQSYQAVDRGMQSHHCCQALEDLGRCRQMKLRRCLQALRKLGFLGTLLLRH